MRPIRTSACNATFRAEGCDDLPARIEKGMVSTFWAPTDEERAMIVAGMPIKLTNLGRNVVPVKLEVDTL